MSKQSKSTTLNQLKVQAYELTGVATTKQLKAKIKLAQALDLRLKKSWQQIVDEFSVSKPKLLPCPSVEEIIAMPDDQLLAFKASIDLYDISADYKQDILETIAEYEKDMADIAQIAVVDAELEQYAREYARSLQEQ